jgi:hypothetical protein
MSGVSPARVDPATAQRVLRVAGAGGAAVVGAAVSGSLATATYFARKVLTPDHRRPDDTEILAVDADRVTLAGQSRDGRPGRYGLWLDGGAGHARVGDILERDGHADTVVRRLISVDKGTLAPGTARWNSYYYWTDPLTSIGLPYRDVAVEGELGPMPAWLLDPGRPTVGGRSSSTAARRAARSACAPSRAPPARLHLPRRHLPQRPDGPAGAGRAATTSGSASGGTSSRLWSMRRPPARPGRSSAVGRWAER